MEKEPEAKRTVEMRPAVHAIVGLPLLLGLTGCIFDADVDDIARAVSHEIEPAELHERTSVRVGRGLLALASVAARLVPDDDARAASRILRGVTEVHVAVYEVDGHFERPVRFPEDLRRTLDRRGWQLLVQIKERSSALWILAMPRGERVRGLAVVVLERDELVVAKLEGDLSRTVDRAVREAMRRDPSIVYAIREAAGS